MTNLTQAEREQHDRALAAERILAEPLVIDALTAIERGIYEAWTTPGLTAEQREELYRRLLSHRAFVSVFEQHLQNGAVARHALGLPALEKPSIFQRIKEAIHGNQKA